MAATTAKGQTTRTADARAMMPRSNETQSTNGEPSAVHRHLMATMDTPTVTEVLSADELVLVFSYLGPIGLLCAATFPCQFYAA